MKKLIAFLIALLTLCMCSISSFATDKVTKEDVLNKITTLSYAGTYYLTEYGDSDNEYECYKNSVSYAGFPTFVFFENDCLVTESTKIGKLSQIAIANYYEEYYATWLNNIDVIDDGLDSAKLNEVIMLVGKYSSKLAGTLLTYNIGIDDAITWPILRGILADVGVSEFTAYLADVENNIDTFNIIYTHSTIEEARELKKQLSLMSENDKKTYSGASVACHRLQKIHENVEMATAMFSQVAYDSPKISDYWEEIGKGFMAGATSGMIDSIFYGPNITSSEAKENYLEQLLHDDRKLDEFHELIRVLYIFDTIDKVAIKNPEYLYKTMQQFSGILPYTKNIIEKYEYAKEYNYIKIATMLNQSLLKENGYKIIYQNNGSSGGTSGDSSYDNYETTENESYVSNYTLSEGTLNLDGQTMYVGGDFLHTGGTLNLGCGKLVIFGNYHITAADGGTCGARLQMINENGHIVVYGDFKVDTTNTRSIGGYSCLTAGTLEVKGNFTQKSTTIDNYSPYSFYTTGTHTVILSGTGEQIVHFEDPGYSNFRNLKVTNQSGLVKFEELPIRGELQSDLISNSDINLHYIDLTLDGHTIKTPNLCMYNDGTLTLGDNVKIDANLMQYTGTLNLTGNVEVNGNYHITNADGGTCGAKLQMINENGHLIVYGDFKVDTTNTRSIGGYSCLTAGTLEVKGNFTQKSTTIDNYSPYSFYTTETHTVILSGTGEQIVHFEDPTNSHFTILINKNSNGVVFATAYRYNELQIIYPFDFEVVEYNAETNQINVDVILSENLQSLDGNVTISLYDESNKLIECRIKELSELEPQTFNGLKDYEGTYIVKAFYWADMTSIKPLCPSIQKELVTK